METAHILDKRLDQDKILASDPLTIPSDRSRRATDKPFFSNLADTVGFQAQSLPDTSLQAYRYGPSSRRLRTPTKGGQTAGAPSLQEPAAPSRCSERTFLSHKAEHTP